MTRHHAPGATGEAIPKKGKVRTTGSGEMSALPEVLWISFEILSRISLKADFTLLGRFYSSPRIMERHLPLSV